MIKGAIERAWIGRLPVLIGAGCHGFVGLLVVRVGRYGAVVVVLIIVIAVLLMLAGAVLLVWVAHWPGRRLVVAFVLHFVDALAWEAVGAVAVVAGIAVAGVALSVGRWT